ncbi:hypothetical protein HY404_04085 [Candidatus Microgenomates bacterium]|nr:hypothetical protein [Candidatus Microgenomates bacterium]
MTTERAPEKETRRHPLLIPHTSTTGFIRAVKLIRSRNLTPSLLITEQLDPFYIEDTLAGLNVLGLVDARGYLTAAGKAMRQKDNFRPVLKQTLTKRFGRLITIMEEHDDHPVRAVRTYLVIKGADHKEAAKTANLIKALWDLASPKKIDLYSLPLRLDVSTQVLTMPEGKQRNLFRKIKRAMARAQRE